MKVLEYELNALRLELLEMASLVLSQINKCRFALENHDLNVASEVIHTEKKINSYELKIDKDCEQLIALHTPVATDLKFVLASLKINYNLERIGDHIVAIAKYIINSNSSFNGEIVEKFDLYKIIDLAQEMVEITHNAIKNDDSQEVRKIFLMDENLDSANDKASEIVLKLIEEGYSASSAIATLSIIRKLERVGDHTKNIAEEIIFYTDQKVLKHHPKKIQKLKNKLSGENQE